EHQGNSRGRLAGGDWRARSLSGGRDLLRFGQGLRDARLVRGVDGGRGTPHRLPRVAARSRGPAGRAALRATPHREARRGEVGKRAAPYAGARRELLFPLAPRSGERVPERSEGGRGCFSDRNVSQQEALSRPILALLGSSTLSRKRERGKQAKAHGSLIRPRTASPQFSPT